MSVEPLEKFYSMEETAAMLNNISLDTLKSYIKKKKIAFHKLGGKNVFTLADIKAYIESTRVAVKPTWPRSVPSRRAG